MSVYSISIHPAAQSRNPGNIGPLHLPCAPLQSSFKLSPFQLLPLESIPSLPLCGCSTHPDRQEGQLSSPLSTLQPFSMKMQIREKQ